MKHLLCIAVLACTAGPALAADLGVSVDIGVPGVYGRVDIGGYPPPRLMYPQPVYVERGPSGPPPPPVYLHVPPGHAKNWRKHCGQYGACGQPVYFVQDNWYRDVYAPRYQERRRREQSGDDRGTRGRDDRDDRRDRDGGRGNGRGHDRD